MASELRITDDPTFTPNPGGQTDFMLDVSHRYVALAGGMGAGKTMAGSRKLLDLHVFNAFDDAGKATLCKSAIVCDTYANLFRYDVPAMEAAALDAGLTCSVRRADPPQIVFPDLGMGDKPSIIYLCTAQKPERISGFEVGAFWCDEASRYPEMSNGDPKTCPMIQIRGRLRGANTRCEQGMFTFTNEGDGTAVYQFFHAEAKDDRAYYTASTRDNEAHVSEFLADQLANLPAHLVDQYVDGKAINLRGAFAYSCFDESLHVRSDITLDPSRPLVLALDFNINPGMHAYLGQYSKQHDTFVIRHEIHESRLTIEGVVDRVRDIFANAGGFNFPGVLVFGDASGRGEWVGTSESHYMVLTSCLDRIGLKGKWRLRVPSANPRVADRVNSVQAALRDMKGRSHVLIHPSCSVLINDLKSVKWDDKGKELAKKNVALTHATDAIGYWVFKRRPLRFRSTSRAGRFSVTA